MVVKRRVYDAILLALSILVKQRVEMFMRSITESSGPIFSSMV